MLPPTLYLVQVKNESLGYSPLWRSVQKACWRAAWLRMEPGVGGRRPGAAGRAPPTGRGRGGRRRLDLSGPGLLQPDAAGPRQGRHASAGRDGALIWTGARGSRRHEVSFNVVLLARGKQALPWLPRRRHCEQKGCVCVQGRAAALCKWEKLSGV